MNSRRVCERLSTSSDKQLREKERLTNRLELLLQALPGGVVVLDRDGVVQECNRAAQNIFDESLRGDPLARCGSAVHHSTARRPRYHTEKRTPCGHSDMFSW